MPGIPWTPENETSLVSEGALWLKETGLAEKLGRGGGRGGAGQAQATLVDLLQCFSQPQTYSWSR